MKKMLFVIALYFLSCTATQPIATTGGGTANVTVQGKLFASLFQQKAAEYRALCLQAFNLARYRLDEYKSSLSKPKAIVTDIDETILDNSPYQVMQSLQGKDYDQESWYQWTSKAVADTLPGAASFLKYAASKGVTIFYITNRDVKEKSSTIQNLQRFSLPNADDAHVLVRESVSSKEARRLKIASTHDIVLLLGDNLADFSSLFDKKTTNERNSNANFAAAQFGNRFIVLPNPVYGDWESSIFNYNYKLQPAQRDSVIKAIMKGY